MCLFLTLLLKNKVYNIYIRDARIYWIKQKGFALSGGVI